MGRNIQKQAQERVEWAYSDWRDALYNQFMAELACEDRTNVAAGKEELRHKAALRQAVKLEAVQAVADLHNTCWPDHYWHWPSEDLYSQAVRDYREMAADGVTTVLYRKAA